MKVNNMKLMGVCVRATVKAYKEGDGRKEGEGGNK